MGKTEQDRTGQDSKDLTHASSDDDAQGGTGTLVLVSEQAPADPGIDVSTLIDVYPRRDGKPWGGGPRREVDRSWRRLTPDEQRAAAAAMPHYAEYTARPDTPTPAYLSTWLNQRRWEDWQSPAATPSPNGSGHGMTLLTAAEQRTARSRQTRAETLAELREKGFE